MAVEQRIDEEKLHAFLGKIVGDLGATMSVVNAVIGDRLGLYRAMAGAGPLTSDDLASRTGLSERYLREWLIHQAAGGYVDYDPTTGRYTLPAEHALALTDEDSPAFVAGGFGVMAATTYALPRIIEGFKTGSGLSWGEHDPSLFVGTERFFRPGYRANLVSTWIPSLDGIHDRLARGGSVADVGCGHGASTIIMAQAYPRSRFVGYDSHAPSIERARQNAAAAGVADRVTFEVIPAAQIPHPGGDPSRGYDLIAFFDCLHDMADPVSAATRAYDTLAKGGAVMLVEPMAGERTEENLNPVGRVYSGASVLICTPNALAGGGTGLGTLASEAALRTVFETAGFETFRRATETPFNRIFEARR
ncbi:MAG: methyltransferase domain-containing protein [Chloroflexi bacterium]|nr:methyltransferase domain-containing protein [Chloroflexota bacterium]